MPIEALLAFITAYILTEKTKFAVQWCIFEEPLYNSRNSKGARAYGAQWGGEHGTMHHCLFAHCVSRSPRFNGVRASVNDRHVDAEFINNVIFNWGNHNSVYGGECSTGVEGDYNRTYILLRSSYSGKEIMLSRMKSQLWRSRKRHPKNRRKILKRSSRRSL